MLWIDGCRVSYQRDLGEPFVDRGAFIDYIKQESGWWSTSGWGLLAFALAAVATWHKINIDSAPHFAGNQDVDQRFHVMVNASGVQLGIYMVLAIAGPVYETWRIRKMFAGELLKLARTP